jgi:uncharacterized membrane protein
LAWGLGALRESYTYDESVTVGLFVQRSGFLESFTTQHVFNNHPLLSASNWLVYQLEGTTEAWQRAVPLAAGVACVVSVVAFCQRRWGLLPGVAAAAVLACNPLFVSLSVQARGYSASALAVALATILLLDADFELGSGSRRISYGACVAVGLLAHLYSVVPIVGHGAVVATRHNEALRTWAVTAAAGITAAGVVSYAWMAPEMLASSGGRTGGFVAEFPLTANEELWGSLWALPAVALVVGGIALRSRSAVLFLAATAALLASIWLVLQPVDLYPRFLLWSVPLVAIGAAFLVAQDRRWMAAPAMLLVIAIPAASDQLDEEPEIRHVASAANRYEAAGRTVCAAGYHWESYLAYGYFEPAADSDRCDLVLVRRRDLPELDVAGMSLASLPQSRSTCVGGSPTVLESVDLRAGSCPAG